MEHINHAVLSESFNEVGNETVNKAIILILKNQRSIGVFPEIIADSNYSRISQEIYKINEDEEFLLEIVDLPKDSDIVSYSNGKINVTSVAKLEAKRIVLDDTNTIKLGNTYTPEDYEGPIYFYVYKNINGFVLSDSAGNSELVYMDEFINYRIH